MIIWNDTPDDPNRLPTLTEDVLNEVETRLGVKLPMDYLEMICVQNGDMSNSAICRLYGTGLKISPSSTRLPGSDYIKG